VLGFQQGELDAGEKKTQRRRCRSNRAAAVAPYQFGEPGRWPAGKAMLTRTSGPASAGLAQVRVRSGPEILYFLESAKLIIDLFNVLFGINTKHMFKCIENCGLNFLHAL
jgi:hypothetical protein